MKLTKYNC